MRRPAVDPEMRGQIVSQRNMMQGMAAGRVPSAYPVPRLRVPRLLGGLKGAAAAPAEPPMTGWSTNRTTGYMGDALQTWGSITPDEGTMLLSLEVAVSGRGAPTLVPPAGWESLLSGSSGHTAWQVIGIDSFAGTEEGDWGAPVPVDGDYTPYEGQFCWTVMVEGATGLSWQTPEATVHTGTVTGGPPWTTGGTYSWEAPDPAWAFHFQTVAFGGTFLPLVTPDIEPAYTYWTMWNAYNQSMHPSPTLFGDPRLAAVTTDPPLSRTDTAPSGSEAYTPAPSPVAVAFAFGAM